MQANFKFTDSSAGSCNCFGNFEYNPFSVHFSILWGYNLHTHIYHTQELGACPWPSSRFGQMSLVACCGLEILQKL